MCEGEQVCEERFQKITLKCIFRFLAKFTVKTSACLFVCRSRLDVCSENSIHVQATLKSDLVQTSTRIGVLVQAVQGGLTYAL